jgi:hypothetical protein
VGINASFQITLHPNINWAWREYQNDDDEHITPEAFNVIFVEYRETASHVDFDEVISPISTAPIASEIIKSASDLYTPTIPRMANFQIGYQMGTVGSTSGGADWGRGVYTVKICTDPDYDNDEKYGYAQSYYAFDIVIGHEPAKFNAYWVDEQSIDKTSFTTDQGKQIEQGGVIYMGYKRYNLGYQATWMGAGFNEDPRLIDNYLWKKVKGMEIDNIKIDRTALGLPVVRGLPPFLQATRFAVRDGDEYVIVELVAGEKVQHGTWNIEFDVVYRHLTIAGDGTRTSVGYTSVGGSTTVKTTISIQAPKDNGINFWWAVAGIGILGSIALLWYLLNNFANANQASHERKVRQREIEAVIARNENLERMRKEAEEHHVKIAPEIEHVQEPKVEPKAEQSFEAKPRKSAPKSQNKTAPKTQKPKAE